MSRRTFTGCWSNCAKKNVFYSKTSSLPIGTEVFGKYVSNTEICNIRDVFRISSAKFYMMKGSINNIIGAIGVNVIVNLTFSS